LFPAFTFLCQLDFVACHLAQERTPPVLADVGDHVNGTNGAARRLRFFGTLNHSNQSGDSSHGALCLHKSKPNFWLGTSSAKADWAASTTLSQLAEGAVPIACCNPVKEEINS
jgi:hypothetical protein